MAKNTFQITYQPYAYTKLKSLSNDKVIYNTFFIDGFKDVFDVLNYSHTCWPNSGSYDESIAIVCRPPIYDFAHLEDDTVIKKITVTFDTASYTPNLTDPDAGIGVWMGKNYTGTINKDTAFTLNSASNIRYFNQINSTWDSISSRTTDNFYSNYTIKTSSPSFYVSVSVASWEARSLVIYSGTSSLTIKDLRDERLMFGFLGYGTQASTGNKIWIKDVKIIIEYESEINIVNVYSEPSNTSQVKLELPLGFHPSTKKNLTNPFSTGYGYTKKYYLEKNSLVTFYTTGYDTNKYIFNKWLGQNFEPDNEFIEQEAYANIGSYDESNYRASFDYVKYYISTLTNDEEGTLQAYQYQLTDNDKFIYYYGDTCVLTGIPNNERWKCLNIYRINNDGTYTLVANNTQDNQLNLSYSFKVTSSNSFTAEFQQVKYLVEFDVNGGSANIEPQVVDINNAIILPSNLTRNDIQADGNYFHFYLNGGMSENFEGDSVSMRVVDTVGFNLLGWKNNNTNEIYNIFNDPSSATQTFNQDTFLIAQWQDYVKKYGTLTIPLSSSLSHPKAYEFIGVANSPTATEIKYQPGEEVIPFDGEEFYAIWKKDITITYDINGGDSGILPSNKTKSIYNNVTETSFEIDADREAKNMIKKGYKFVGWSNDPLASPSEAKVAGSFISNVSEDTIIYAIWEIQQFEITTKIFTQHNDEQFYEETTGGEIQDSLGNVFTSGKFDYGSTVILKAIENDGYNFFQWENNLELGIYHKMREIKVVMPDTDIHLNIYFIKKHCELNISCSDPNSTIKVWIKENDQSEWYQVSNNDVHGFNKISADFKILIEDTEEDYLSSANFSNTNSSEIIKLSRNDIFHTVISDKSYLRLESKKQQSCNYIYVGNLQKTKGKIKNPNYFKEEKIESVWIGNKQIMGKKLIKSQYPEDVILGNTLYIGYNTSNVDAIYEAFVNNTQIEKIKFPTYELAQKYFTLDRRPFAYCSNLNYVDLNDSVASISNGTFYLCNKLKKIIISPSINSIQGNPIMNTGGHKYFVDINNPYFSSDSQGALYNKDFSVLRGFPTVSPSRQPIYFIPKSVKEIGSYAMLTQYFKITILYEGTQEDWDKIQIDSSNDQTVNNATIFFNYKQGG